MKIQSLSKHRNVLKTRFEIPTNFGLRRPVGQKNVSAKKGYLYIVSRLVNKASVARSSSPKINVWGLRERLMIIPFAR